MPICLTCSVISAFIRLATSTELSTKPTSPNAASSQRKASIWLACGWRPGVGTVTRVTV
jgi:hypothetical protein